MAAKRIGWSFGSSRTFFGSASACGASPVESASVRRLSRCRASGRSIARFRRASSIAYAELTSSTSFRDHSRASPERSRKAAEYRTFASRKTRSTGKPDVASDPIRASWSAYGGESDQDRGPSVLLQPARGDSPPRRLRCLAEIRPGVARCRSRPAAVPPDG
jgi:hypothetical protein